MQASFAIASAPAPGALLEATVDGSGRTVILAHASGRRSPQALLISLLNLGDALRQTARRLGLSNLAARICVGLIEQGSLRAAATACGVSYHTARSELRDAMQWTEVTSQSGLVRVLAGDWLSHPLDGERAVTLLMKTFGLRRRDAQVAALRAAGLSRPDAARRLGMSRWAMEDCSSRIYTSLGVSKAPELTRLVIDLLLASDLAENGALAAPQGESA